MVETIGNKLQRARLEKKIALEDAAYATKINAARLSDIETDVYTNFPNIAYAKGFLQIYSNYLGVDAQPYLSAFEDANTFGLDDYQYLSDVPIAQFRAQRRTGGIGGSGGGSSRQRRRRSRRLLAGALTLVLLALGAFAWYLVLSFQRLGNIEQLASRNGSGGAKAPAATASTANAKLPSATGAENPQNSAPTTTTAGSATVPDPAKAPGSAGTTADREGALSIASGGAGAPAAAHSGLPNTLSALPEDGSVASALVPPLGNGESAVVAATSAPVPASSTAAAPTPEPIVRTALPVVPAPRNSTANHASKTATAVRR